MGQLELSQAAQQWVNVVLIWIGFGTLAGLLAKALVPGREPGAVGTILIGILGSVIGPLATVTLLGREDFNPISPLGLLAAIGGAVLLLSAHRLIAIGLSLGRAEEGGEGRE